MSIRSSLVRPSGDSELLEELGLRDLSTGPLSAAQAALTKRLEALALEEASDIKARFRIELFFRGGPRRRS